MLIKTGPQTVAVRSGKRPQKASGDVSPQKPIEQGGPRTLVDVLSRGVVTAYAETAAALQNDPALAAREAATSMSELFNRGYDSETVTMWSPKIHVAARSLILGANVIKLNRSLHTEGYPLWLKGLDAARVATDLMGIAGAVMKAVSPQHAALGGALLGWAQGADLVSHTARLAMHVEPRAKEWLKFHTEQRDHEKARERERLKLETPVTTSPTATV